MPIGTGNKACIAAAKGGREGGSPPEPPPVILAPNRAGGWPSAIALADSALVSATSRSVASEPSPQRLYEAWLCTDKNPYIHLHIHSLLCPNGAGSKWHV